MHLRRQWCDVFHYNKMNSFNKTEAANFQYRLFFLGTFPCSQIYFKVSVYDRNGFCCQHTSMCGDIIDGSTDVATTEPGEREIIVRTKNNNFFQLRDMYNLKLVIQPFGDVDIFWGDFCEVDQGINVNNTFVYN